MQLYKTTTILALILFLSSCHINQPDQTSVNEALVEKEQQWNTPQMEPVKEAIVSAESINTPETKETERADNVQLGTDTLQPAEISPLEKFLSEIKSNIEKLNEDFTITIEGLTQDDIGNVDLLEHFPELRKAHWRGTFYNNHAIIEMSVTIAMEYKIFTAYQTKRVALLTAEEKQVLDVVLNVIHNQISKDMSDYEKELTIHDYIILNCTYDSINHHHNTIPESSYTSYGVLVLGIAVCQGYSSAFKLFMDMLNIECDIITGKADDENHAWNRVKIDGDYYLVDVTWNGSISDSNNRVHYDFFNLTDEVLNASHIPSKPQVKAAHSTRYNYFHYNNLTVANKDDFLVILQDALDRGENYVYILYDDIDLRELIESQDIFKHLKGKSRITYSFSDKVNTLYLQFE